MILENDTGKCYIGQTIKTLGRRKSSHMMNKDDYYFQRALKKYDNWNWYIVQEYEADNKVTLKSILNKAEIHYIEVYDSFNSGCNMTKGGGGSAGKIPWNKGTGKPKPPKKKTVVWNKGLKPSKQAIEKNRLAHLGKKQSANHIKKKVESRCGYQHSEDTKQKIAAGNKGKVRSEETKLKQSIAAKNKKPMSDETKQKLKEATQRYWDNKKASKGNKI